MSKLKKQSATLGVATEEAGFSYPHTDDQFNLVSDVSDGDEIKKMAQKNVIWRDLALTATELAP